MTFPLSRHEGTDKNTVGNNQGKRSATHLCRLYALLEQALRV